MIERDQESYERRRMRYGEIQLYAGSACPELAEKIATYLDVDLKDRDIIEFPNENIFLKLHSSARGQDCFVIQTHATPLHRNLMEMLIMIQTLRLDYASRVTAVMPYMAYSRSDKKDQPRVPITARLVADMIEVAGASRYITLDLHAGQIQGFFSVPGDVLRGAHVLNPYLRQIRPQMKDPVVVTADLGFAKKGRQYASVLNAPMAFIEKRRVANDAKAEALTLIGDVNGRDVVLVDDEVDTGGTLAQAVNVIKDHGAANVFMVFVHPVLSRNAAERLSALPVKEFITTDTLPISNEKRAFFGERLTVLTVSQLLGEVILRAHEGRSVGAMFNE